MLFNVKICLFLLKFDLLNKVPTCQVMIFAVKFVGKKVCLKTKTEKQFKTCLYIMYMGINGQCCVPRTLEDTSFITEFISKSTRMFGL